MSQNRKTENFFCYIPKRSNCLEELEWIVERYQRKYISEEINNKHVKKYTKSPENYHNGILREENQIDVDQVMSSSKKFEFMDIPQYFPRYVRYEFLGICNYNRNLEKD